MNIGKELAIIAKKKGICKEWLLELKSTEDKEKLLDMYVRGIDFCLSNDFPDNNYILKTFTRYELNKYGIRIDEHISAKNETKVIALGKCEGSIIVEEFNTCEIFLKHKSEVSLSAKGNSFVMIDIFDDSNLFIYATDQAKVVVNRYGGNVSPNNAGNAIVRVKEKNKKTY